MHVAARAAIALIFASSPVAARETWFRDPAVSPDGSQILFTHAGDIYRVSAEGGEATPLIIHEAWEGRPVWSHDGSMIAFASDRHGDLDVFVAPAAGGRAKRITHHSSADVPFDFAPDGETILFGSARIDSPTSAYYPTGALPELYEARVEGGTPRMLLTVPAIDAKWAPDGGSILYVEEKSYEDPLRKHDVSAFARDVWRYDASEGSHVRLTDYEGGDHSPVWTPDGGVAVLSERGSGHFNVWRLGDDEAEDVQITNHQDFPARSLSVSRDGLYVYSLHGVIYAVKEGEEPVALSIRLPAQAPLDEPRPLALAGEATEFVVSPDGKDVAFVARGDVFVASIEFGTTVQVTDTPEQERSVSFHPEGRALVYATERDGAWKIAETRLSDEEERRFSVATSFVESIVYEHDGEAFQPAYSPDGERIAFVRNRDAIWTVGRDGSGAVEVFGPQFNYSYADGDIQFDWSPDSRWIAATYSPRAYFFYADIGVAPADGSAPPRDVSISGYGDYAPVWHAEGAILLFASDRYGERSHGSWGGEGDVVAAFLTQESWDKFHLTKEEKALIKEAEEVAEDEDAPEVGGDASEGIIARLKLPELPFFKSDDAEVPEEPVEFDWDGVERRTRRMTIHSSDLGGMVLSADTQKLFYLSAFEGGYDIWVRDFLEDETRLLAKLDADDVAGPELSSDGEAAVVLADGALVKITLTDGTIAPIGAAPEKVLAPDSERAYLFEHVWRQVADKFYDPDYHGVDWANMKAAYSKKLPAIANNRDLATLLSEMLGELNASHTGAFYRDGSFEDDQTAALGVIFDLSAFGSGLTIAEVLPGGPLARADLGVRSGMRITSIDGVELTEAVNAFRLLNRKASERMRLTIDPSGVGGAAKSFDVVVRPISRGEEARMLYERWIDRRRQLTEKLSGGRIGYLHVRSMSDSGYRQAFGELFGRNFDKEAVVVDTRFNGGGWLHDDLLVLLSGERYFDMRARGRVIRGEPVERWTKPSAVLMNEGNYSDAFMFPFVYDKFDIGPTVGMPVPGTGTAVWWETLHTGDITFGIPQLPALDEGAPVENRQLEPDYPVDNDPGSAAAGEDLPLAKAVAVLLDGLDE